jgi:hypothetical protein
MSSKFVEEEEWLRRRDWTTSEVIIYLGGLRVLLEALDNDLMLDENGRDRATGLILGVRVNRL